MQKIWYLSHTRKCPYGKFGNFREGFIFARVLFSRNFAYAKFRENKILAKWRHHCHLLMKVNHVIVANFYVANMSFNAILENKIIAKISEFTVINAQDDISSDFRGLNWV